MLRTFRQHIQSFLIVSELFTDIPGQKIIGGSPSIGAVRLSVKIHIDHATQIARQFFLGLAGKLRHICHINHCFFCNRDCQCFRSGIDRCDNFAGLNGTLGKHIRLAFQIVVLIENFQRAEQIIGAIVRKSKSIATAVDETALCGKIIVEFI